MCIDYYDINIESSSNILASNISDFLIIDYNNHSELLNTRNIYIIDFSS